VFGGFCLLLFLAMLWLPVLGCGVFVMPVFGVVLWSDFF
jgi:hypothetical protein